MLESWQHVILIFIAIAIGWLLGGGVRRFKSPKNASVIPPQYYKGLNYLLNDEPDGALDTFISELEVNSETLETHIAVGNLMRRKGEVERAIRIHQNLLARPSLPRDYLHQAHLELAKDYISAGLLDRAETLLEDLVEESPQYKSVAMHHLLEIYQDEKEWERAIDVAKQLLPKKSLLKLKSTRAVDSQMTRAIAHYHCQLAVIAQQKNDFHAARGYLKQALGYDKKCVRASLLMAEIEFSTGHYAHALKSLHKVREQDMAFVPETIDLLRRVYSQQNNESAFHEYMQQCLNDYPSASIMLALVDEVRNRQDDQAAASFIGRELRRHPSLRGLGKLVELHIAYSEGKAKENLSLLQQLITQLMKSKPYYQCQHCGFSGKKLHWLCPGCKTWGEMQSIRGAEGD